MPSDEQMKTYNIAAVLEKNNVSHGAKEVAAQLQKVYENRYGINLQNDAGFVASDTTPCAHNVGENLDAYQQDCEMHIIALLMNYALGWNENTRTVTETDEVSSLAALTFFGARATSPVVQLIHCQNGKQSKVQHIVTPGREFPDFERIIKVARKQVNYFGASCQRGESVSD